MLMRDPYLRLGNNQCDEECNSRDASSLHAPSQKRAEKNNGVRDQQLNRRHSARVPIHDAALSRHVWDHSREARTR